MSPTLIIGCLGAYLVTARLSSQAAALALALSVFAITRLVGGY